MQLEILIYEYRHLGVYDFFFMFSKEFSKEEGQSLIELIVASAIFMVVVSAIAYLVLDTYILDRDASERAQAVFIAEEGLEAARSIRDNDWDDVPDTDGDGLLGKDYCVELFGGVWVFSSDSPPCPAIGKFNRVINLLSISSAEKQVTSRVTYDFKKGEMREIKLVSYLTNWQTVPCSGDNPLPCNSFFEESSCTAFGCDWNPGYCSGTYGVSCSEFDGNRALCMVQPGCTWNGGPKTCSGIYTANCDDNFFDQFSCEGQTGCAWNLPVCGGTPNGCDFYGSQTTCEGAGCIWQ